MELQADWLIRKKYLYKEDTIKELERFINLPVLQSKSIIFRYHWGNKVPNMSARVDKIIVNQCWIEKIIEGKKDNASLEKLFCATIYHEEAHTIVVEEYFKTINGKADWMHNLEVLWYEYICRVFGRILYEVLPFRKRIFRKLRFRYYISEVHADIRGVLKVSNVSDEISKIMKYKQQVLLSQKDSLTHPSTEERANLAQTGKFDAETIDKISDMTKCKNDLLINEMKKKYAPYYI